MTNKYDSENNPFDRQQRIGWWDQDKLRNARIMIVGAGAIGNEVLKNLALLGVGYLFIVDFDVVSVSNLSRTVLFRKEDVGKRKAEIAAKRVKEIGVLDDMLVDWFHGDLVWDLGTGIYRDMDIVLGCLDNVETRVAVNKHCWLTNTPWIDAGMKELGMRVEFYNPPNLPCYQCNLTKEQLANARRRYSCDEFKKTAIDEGKVPTTQITSSLVAALQVQEAVKYLCGQEVMTGKKIYYQGTVNDFDVLSKGVNVNCIGHVHYDEIVSLPLGVDSKLRDFLEQVNSEDYSDSGAVLDLTGDRSFVKSVRCKSCLKKIDIMRPTYRVSEKEWICKECRNRGDYSFDNDMNIESLKETQDVFGLDDCEESILDLTLEQIGIPICHVVAVFDKNGDYKYYELTGDKKLYLSR